MQNARKMGSNIIFSSGFVSSGLTQVGTGALSLPEGFMVHFSLLALCLAWHSQPSIEMNKQGKSAWGEEWDQATQCLELMLAISADHGSVETRRPFRFNFLFYFMTALLVRLGLGPETSGTWNMKKIQTIQWFHAYRCWNAMSDSGLWLGNFLSWLFRHHHPLHLPTCIIIHMYHEHLDLYCKNLSWYRWHAQIWMCTWFAEMKTFFKLVMSWIESLLLTLTFDPPVER